MTHFDVFLIQYKWVLIYGKYKAAFILGRGSFQGYHWGTLTWKCLKKPELSKVLYRF